MDNPMTVAQALRHARHDFLNELQLINMKLDLGREQEVKSIIRSHAEAAVQLSRLSALQMPATEDWLLTAEWRFPDFRFQLDCPATAGDPHKDEAFAAWLERFFRNASPQTHSAETHTCRITLESAGSHFTIHLKINGSRQHEDLPEMPGLLARTRVAADSTEIIVSAKMEG